MVDGAYDQFFSGEIYSDADIGADDFMKDREFRKGIEQWERVMREEKESRRRRSYDALEPKPRRSLMKKIKSFFVKSAEAGELRQTQKTDIGDLEPLQPIGDFIAENDGRRRDVSTKRSEKRAAMMERRRARKEKEASERFPKESTEGNASVESMEPKAARSSATDDSVGVRGWCHCWEKTPPGYNSSTGIGDLIRVGDGNTADPSLSDDPSLSEVEEEGDYSYRICSRCGRCYSMRTRGDKSEADILDLKIYNKYHEEAGSSIPVHTYKNMLRESEDRLLSIPDGQIVIHGTCQCKRPDPVSVALVVNEKFYVCCFCGRVRLPDESGAMPTGPTAWRMMMGPERAFPGYKDKR